VLPTTPNEPTGIPAPTSDGPPPALGAHPAASGPLPAARPQVTPSLVAAALAELATLPEVPLAEHPDTYQRIHATLQTALAAIDGT
jgi:hypothetical protein